VVIFCIGQTVSVQLLFSLSWFLQVRENWKKSEFEWSGKGQGKYFFGKVGENEKLVPADVIFSGQNASISISAGAVLQTLLGELTALPQTP